MTLLVILLPAPPRADAPPPAEPAALDWLLSPDGLAVGQRGSSAAAALPPADTVVAVAPPEAVAWHRPVCPKAPANRLRAALGGLLEERLLAEDDEVHLALAPKPVAGAPVWVAALHKPWLQRQLDQLAAAGRVVDRLVPALAPLLQADAAPSGHVHHGSAGRFSPPDPADGSDDQALQLAWADADGAVDLPLAGGLARSLLPGWLARGASWSATPAAAAAAERWLGAPVAVRSEAEATLAAVRSPWNLLQFDLAPRHRGSLAAGNLWRRLMGPDWAPARWGLLALVLVQLVGLNARAWQQRSALAQQRSSQEELLRRAHPHVRAVLDAPLQMQRETAALRSAAGVPGDEDFETLLAATASAWPDGQPAAAQLRFEPGRLSLPGAGWPPPQVDALRQRLGALGWGLEQTDGQLVIRKASPAAANASATVAAGATTPPDHERLPLTSARVGARAWWASLARRERRLVLAAAGLLAVFVLWQLALAPALRTLASAPAQLAAAEAQLQQMQALASEAGTLRAVAPVPMAQAQAALGAATQRLGEGAKLSLQGERAVVALKGISGDQLAGWLAEARAGARARVVEASLSQTTPGLYDGSLTLALGAAR